MIVITVGVVICALPQINWSQVHFGRINHEPFHMWQAFVAIVLALSGVEAIANLTGVMQRPVYKTAKKSIWLVAAEVAIFNLLLAAAMCAISPLGRNGHEEDMLAYMAGHYVGAWGEWPVRILGGLLLLSATNTAVGALMGTLYVMSRDGELPAFLQKLNGFGAPWVGAIIAAGVPALVLVFVSKLSALAHLYAIGIVGAVAISCTVSAFHPRLRRYWRKIPMILIGALLIAIWITLATTKIKAVIFVTIVMTVGLSARQLTRWMQKRRPKPSLLRQAIMDQLTAEALHKPRILLATAGSDALAQSAIEVARKEDAALVVCFIREVALNFLVEAENRLTLETDAAAQALFVDFLEHGHRHGVPIIPAYDTGTNSTELLAELAAINGVQKVLIGSSRRGAIHQMIKGSFQQKLEAMLPEDIPVQVLSLDATPPPARAA
jgi:amino acid transporter